MTDTPEPDLDRMISDFSGKLRAIYEKRTGGDHTFSGFLAEFLAVVTPVIRRQERAAVAEEIARAIGEECRVKLIDIPGMHMSAPTSPTLTARHTRDIVAAQAAAIARAHSQPITEEET